jgi:hypothetical protein
MEAFMKKRGAPAFFVTRGVMNSRTPETTGVTLVAEPLAGNQTVGGPCRASTSTGVFGSGGPLTVVAAGPTLLCRSTAASTIRRRVSACCSARRFRV